MKNLFLLLAIFAFLSFKPVESKRLKHEKTTLISFISHAQQAKKLGYSKTNYRSHGQAIYYKSKAKSTLKYITPDVDAHNGGFWKAASSVRNLGSKSTRSGTYNADLTKRIGD